jgi:glutamate N-acetyltransferase/amino-acid N-acetyltransferase
MPVMPDASVASPYAITSVEGGVTAPLGFTSAALHCGIKASALDLVILASDQTASAAGLFTTNLVKAAPVLVSQEHLVRTNGRGRAVVVNSGCANACTGDEGMRNARVMASTTAESLECPAEEVLVASTGVIGVGLKMPQLTAGIRKAARMLTRGQGLDAARAIMTTDTFPKFASVAVDTEAGRFLVAGMAKGAGMIEPRMATMLGFLTTDANVAPALLKRALAETARDTFNAITIDGDTSTNDSLFALASGASGVTVGDTLYPALVEAMTTVSRALAIDVVRGGEGATKLITITVRGAADRMSATAVAKTIANSPLVKTAVHGADPNWGRILAACGRAGVLFDPAAATVRVGGVLLFQNGLPHDDAAPQAGEHLRGDSVSIDVDLGMRPGAQATVWTCDLSAEYVRINGEYRT